MEKKNGEEKQSIWSKVLTGLNRRQNLRDHGPATRSRQAPARKSIVAPERRPSTRFELVNDRTIPDQYFERLRRLIFKQLDELRGGQESAKSLSPIMFREAGRVSDNRSYFYLKEPGETGWLFERAGNGWIISRCEKIHGSGTFIRRTDAWDIVNLFAPSEGDAPVRVTSQRTGGDMISFFVYESKILAALGLSNGQE
jgi:hypothetical protein